MFNLCLHFHVNPPDFNHLYNSPGGSIPTRFPGSVFSFLNPKIWRGRREEKSYLIVFNILEHVSIGKNLGRVPRGWVLLSRAQNHRMVEVGRNLLRSPSPSPAQALSAEQITQDCVQLDFDVSIAKSP